MKRISVPMLCFFLIITSTLQSKAQEISLNDSLINIITQKSYAYFCDSIVMVKEPYLSTNKIYFDGTANTNAGIQSIILDCYYYDESDYVLTADSVYEKELKSLAIRTKRERRIPIKLKVDSTIFLPRPHKDSFTSELHIGAPFIFRDYIYQEYLISTGSNTYKDIGIRIDKNSLEPIDYCASNWEH